MRRVPWDVGVDLPFSLAAAYGLGGAANSAACGGLSGFVQEWKLSCFPGFWWEDIKFSFAILMGFLGVMSSHFRLEGPADVCELCGAFEVFGLMCTSLGCLRALQPVLFMLYGDGATRVLQGLCQQVRISAVKLGNPLCSPGKGNDVTSCFTGWEEALGN